MPTRRLPAALLLAFLLACASCAAAPAPAIPPDPVTGDLTEALAIAVAALADQKGPPEDYVAIEAKQFYFEGKYVWIVTFKAARLLPEDPSTGLIGLGGEWFARVDLDSKEVVFTGGE